MPWTTAAFDSYPFCLETVRQLERIDFHTKVTYLIGENGSGKSTRLEALATAYGLIPFATLSRENVIPPLQQKLNSRSFS